MGQVTHHRKGHGKGDALAEVMAGCTVRARLRLTDGGVALDWTDEGVAYRDIRVWSDARQGAIARPAHSVDPDDPTLLVVEHTTSVSDLPGIHRLMVTVTYMGWTAAHTVAAYVLSNNLVYGGTNPSGQETETELEVRLHDVSTTFLRRLIDHLLRLRGSENERLTALETETGRLRSDADSLGERMETAEGDIGNLNSAVTALEGDMAEALTAAKTAEETAAQAAQAASSLETAVSSNSEAIVRVGEYALGLGESKQDTLTAGDNITIRDNVISATGGGGADVEPITDGEIDGLFSDIDSRTHTLTVEPAPDDAEVTIDGAPTRTAEVAHGAVAGWTVSKEGYAARSGTVLVTEDTVIGVALAEYTEVTLRVSNGSAAVVAASLLDSDGNTLSGEEDIPSGTYEDTVIPVDALGDGRDRPVYLAAAFADGTAPVCGDSSHCTVEEAEAETGALFRVGGLVAGTVAEVTLVAGS